MAIFLNKKQHKKKINYINQLDKFKLWSVSFRN